MISLIFGSLVALTAIIIVSVPFVKNRGPNLNLINHIEDLRRRRFAVYDEIVVLRNDFNIGQVPTDTYAVALQKYRTQAAILLKEEDEMLRVDQQLETEIRSHRRIVESTDSIGNDLSCPNCNKLLSNTTDPCPDCGVHGGPDNVRD